MSEERTTEEVVEQPAETVGETATTETPADETAQTVEEPKQSPTDWKDREIARQRERRRAEERKVAELEAELAQYKQQVPQTQKPLDPTDDFNRRVAEEARRQAAAIAAEQSFTTRCNEAAEKGRETYQDFDSKVASLRRSVDIRDPNDAAKFNQFLLAALETGEAPKLIYELGSNPEEAERVLNLSPTRMAVELTKMAVAGGGSPQPSRAPRPITPVTQTTTNRSPINPDDPDRADQLSTAEWIRRREAQLNERNGSVGGRRRA